MRKKCKTKLKIGTHVVIKNGVIRKANAENLEEGFMGICLEDIKKGDVCIIENGLLKKADK